MSNRYENIGRYISQIYRKGNSHISKELSQYEIGYGQFMFLIQLYKEDGRKQEDLAYILNIDKGTTARAIKKLEEQGFIIRVRDNEDKRAYKIYLTDRGKEIEDKIYFVLDSWEDKITSNLSTEEKETMKSLLKKISINLN